MNKAGLTLIVFFIIVHGAFAQLDKLFGKAKKAASDQSLTTDEVVRGLKEALTTGISKGADLVSKTDGYFQNPEIKIPFPPEVKKVEDHLRQLGMGGEVDKFVVALNRGDRKSVV